MFYNVFDLLVCTLSECAAYCADVIFILFGHLSRLRKIQNSILRALTHSSVSLTDRPRYLK